MTSGLLLYIVHRPVTSTDELVSPMAASSLNVYELPAYPREYAGKERIRGFLPFSRTTSENAAIDALIDTTLHEYVAVSEKDAQDDTIVLLSMTRSCPRQCCRVDGRRTCLSWHERDVGLDIYRQGYSSQLNNQNVLVGGKHGRSLHKR